MEEIDAGDAGWRTIGVFFSLAAISSPAVAGVSRWRIRARAKADRGFLICRPETALVRPRAGPAPARFV